MYKCVKGFSVPMCDGDGFELEGEDSIVEKGSIWYIPEDENYRFIGGEIRLENDDLGWLEISKETFDECFELIA